MLTIEQKAALWDKTQALRKNCIEIKTDCPDCINFEWCHDEMDEHPHTVSPALWPTAADLDSMPEVNDAPCSRKLYPDNDCGNCPKAKECLI